MSDKRSPKKKRPATLMEAVLRARPSPPLHRNASKPRWMILPPDGDWAEYTSRWSKRLCISDFVRDCRALHRSPPYKPTWADLQREGYQCFKVKITPGTRGDEE